MRQRKINADSWSDEHFQSDYLQPSSFHKLSEIETEECIEAIDILNGQLLHEKLYEKLIHIDIQDFIFYILAPLTTRVGHAWESGRIDIFSEQLYTQVVARMLRASMAKIKQEIAIEAPKVLLTNLSRERHFLGLMMVETLLAAEGCQCVLVDNEISVQNILEKIKKEKFDILAMSFTDIHSRSYVVSNLECLREFIPKNVQIWVGGACQSLYQLQIAGITAEKDLKKVPRMLQKWRETYMNKELLLVG